jgi:acyl dehydratase
LSSSSVRVPADMGRRYARVGGDANPIHLTALTAKAFGFPRAIAHGMWTLGRSLAEIDTSVVPLPRRIAVRFIRPVLLPSSIVVEARRHDDGGPLLLSVVPDRPGAPHILGRIEPLS